MNNGNKKQQRAKRIRGNISGTSDRPRLSIDRSNEGMYAQVIDDTIGKTLFGVSLKNLDKVKGTKSEKAKALGIAVASEAKKHKVSKVVFDKGSFRYHGRVKAFADGAREGGLDF
jgi:large subunit ribosomal protein L18